MKPISGNHWAAILIYGGAHENIGKPMRIIEDFIAVQDADVFFLVGIPSLLLPFHIAVVRIEGGFETRTKASEPEVVSRKSN